MYVGNLWHYQVIFVKLFMGLSTLSCDQSYLADSEEGRELAEGNIFSIMQTII